MPKEKYKKKEPSHFYCLTIARSISEIIKFSVDDDFRGRSFKALGVFSSKDVENEVYKKLLTSTESPNCLVPGTVTSDEESENQQMQKCTQVNLPQSLSQSEEKCEVLNEHEPDLSQTIFSQICSQISQEQEERRQREKNILLKINSGIINPKNL